MSEVRRYEVIYIITPEATDEVVADLHKQVEAVVQRFGGSIEKPRTGDGAVSHTRSPATARRMLEVLNGPGRWSVSSIGA